jgi:hypothetical protein
MAAASLAPEQVNRVIERLEQIEQQHKKIALVRNIGLGLIVLGTVVLSTRFYNLYDDISSNKQAYAQEIGNALKAEYQPQLSQLSGEMSNRLKPLLIQKTQQTIKEWSPKIMTIGQQVSDENKALLKKHVDQMTKNIISDLQNQLTQGISTQTATQNLANLDAITARLTPKIQASLDAKIQALTPSIQQAGQLVEQIGKGAEAQNLTIEKAQHDLAETILDLLRFELNPESGNKPAALN